MSDTLKHPDYAAYQQARQFFREKSREERLALMRRAGALGVTPHVGDHVQVNDADGRSHHGVVVGADQEGRVRVVHRRAGVGALSTLEDFAAGGVVRLVQRAPAGREQEVAARAAQHVNKPFSIKGALIGALLGGTVGAISGREVGTLLGGLGLILGGIALSEDKTWSENLARYRLTGG